MYKDFKKILAALKYWNISLSDPSIQRNFQSRMILQKLTFICQSLGIQLKYKFNLYVHGPYCSALAGDYYQYHNNVLKGSTSYVLGTMEMEILEVIKDYIFSHPVYERNKMDFLEAIATIFYYRKNYPELLDDGIFKRTKKNKPYLKDRIITVAINSMKELTFKPEYITDEIKKELDLWDRADD